MSWLQKKEDENSGCDRICDGSQKCSANSLFNPWNIALSEILPAVGCHRLSHCGKALCDQILQLTGRRKSGNRLRAEQVNGSLHNHCTGCGDGKLECHRNAHRELMAGICRMKLPVVFFRPHIRHGAINIKKTEHSRNSLGENGCISGSRNAHVKMNDEKIPRLDMDQVHLPDPIENGIRALQEDNLRMHRQIQEMEKCMQCLKENPIPEEKKEEISENEDI